MAPPLGGARAGTWRGRVGRGNIDPAVGNIARAAPVWCWPSLAGEVTTPRPLAMYGPELLADFEVGHAVRLGERTAPTTGVGANRRRHASQHAYSQEHHNEESPHQTSHLPPAGE